MEVLEGFPNCSTKNLNKEPSRLAFITALDPTEYWGMIRECVFPFFTNCKIQTTKEAKHARVTLSERAAYGLIKKS